MSNPQVENLQSGYRALQLAAAEGGITSAGKAWLIRVTDPWHDNNSVPCFGIPDDYEGRSIVRYYEQEQTISAQDLLAGLGADDKWSLNIAILPFLYPINFKTGLYSEGVWQPLAGASTIGLGPIEIVATKDGSAYTAWPRASNDTLWDLSDQAGERQYTYMDPIYIQNGSTYLPDNGQRLVGIGFQVQDLTNPFYQQGSCSVYRLNTDYDRQRHQMAFVNADPPTDPLINYCPAALIQLPASTSQQVSSTPHFRSWAAKEGCYCVGVFDPKCLTDFAYFTDRPEYAGIMGFNRQNMRGVVNPEAASTPSNTGLTVVDPPFSIMSTGTQTSGAIFNGLHKNAVLRVKAIQVVESIPDQFSPDIHLALQASAPFDPAALEAYRLLVKKLPAGCTWAENPFGEWFDKVMHFLAGVAPTIGRVFGTTVAGAPGSAMGENIGNTASSVFTYAREFNASLR